MKHTPHPFLPAPPFNNRRRLLRALPSGVLLLSLPWALGLAGCGGSDDDDSETGRADDPMPAPNSEMQAVLDELALLGARPINQLTTAQARSQPSPADAVRSLIVKRGGNPAPTLGVRTENRSFAGPYGAIAVRLYYPPGTGPFPVLMYIHGGGWVLATIDTYDASARGLAAETGAIVVAVEYRKAPENPFPVAHEETWAAWRWTVENAASFGGLAAQVAVAGESAGGNMAASVALRARDSAGVRQPVHQLLIYPVVDAALDSPSEQQNRNAAPLNTASLAWFFDRYLPNAADRTDPRFALLNNRLQGVAPATVITADIDPLRSEGRAYAAALADAGVPVRWANFEGVAHEFFGMGAVVAQARSAMTLAAGDLRAAFARSR